MDGGLAEPADPRALTRLLVASTGEAFDQAVIDQAAQLGGRSRATMHVLSIAHVYGTALGLQHPGLYPSKREWKAQTDLVAEAVKLLKARGFEAEGRVVASRHPAKTIANMARAAGCQAIVIGARPLSTWRRLLFQDEVGKLVRRAGLPVYVVEQPAAT